MILCNECSYNYELEGKKNINGKWLIRTTDSKILGPYDYDFLHKLISDKKVVFLDEVSLDGDDWTLIKNIDLFKGIALHSSYDLNESTVDVDLNKINAEKVKNESNNKKHVARPPLFKHLKDKTKEAKKLFWSKERRISFVIILIVPVLSLALYSLFGKKQDKNSDAFSSYSSGTDTFNKYYIEGRELEEGGLFKDAEKDYDKVLSINKTHSGAMIRKAAIDFIVNEQTSSASKDLEKLYSDINIGKITDQEEQTDIKTFLGILESKKANNQSAIGYFNQALAIKPTNAYLYYNIGMVLFKQGSYLESSEYFKNAQKLSPMFTDAMIYEGLSLIKLNKYKEASKIFINGVVQNPNIRQFYTLGAYSIFKTLGAEKSIDLLKRMASIDPYYTQKIFTPLCQIKHDNTIQDEISLMLDMIKDFNDSQRAQANSFLALLYTMDANYDNPLKLLSIVNTEKSSVAQLILGIIAYNQGKYDDADKKFAKALELDYSSNIAHIYAGQIALKKDDMGQAKNHFTKAQAINEQTSLYAITLLGDINISIGESNQAMVLWKKVLSYDSHYIPAWERVLELNKRLNKNH
ncbi:MAG: tetratricopeptide repeat protein [bacterium]